MISYSEREIFTRTEVATLQFAQLIVDHCSYFEPGSTEEPVRCHELARVVAIFLGTDFQVQDGRFGFVEHSWIWMGHLNTAKGRLGLPKILDVYVPGSLPQVQIVDSSTALPQRYSLAALPDLTVRTDVIDRLSEAIAPLAIVQAWRSRKL